MDGKKWKWKKWTSDLAVWDKIQRNLHGEELKNGRDYTNGAAQKRSSQITPSWTELHGLLIKLIRRAREKCVPLVDLIPWLKSLTQETSMAFFADSTGFQQRKREVEFTLKVRQQMQKSGLRKKDVKKKKICWYFSSVTRRSLSKWPLPLFCLITYLHGGKRKFPRTYGR